MEVLGAERRERRHVENLSKLVGLEKLEGLRFKYRPQGQLGRIFVKVVGGTEQGVDLRAVESGNEYKDVPPSQLSIGIGTRREGDPLMVLLKENGMESEMYLQRQSFGSDGQRAEFGTPLEGWEEFPPAARNPARGFSAPVAFGRGNFDFHRGPLGQHEEFRRPVPMRPGFHNQPRFPYPGQGVFPGMQ